MYQPPRFFTFTARAFDGVTALAASGLTASPGNPVTASRVSANQARIYAHVAENMGRFSYDDLVRPGNLGALVMARLIGGATADTDRVEVRSANAAEKVAGETLPEDGLQQSIGLTGEWSKPFVLEPRDALAVYHVGTDTAGVQFIVSELDQQAWLGWFSAKAKDPCCDKYTEAAVDVTVENDDQIVALTALNVDVVQVRVAATARGVVTLPAWSNLPEGARLDIVREGPGTGVVLIRTAGGSESINGDPTLAMPIYLPLQGALRIVRERSTGDFTTTSHAETATATTTVDLTYLYGWPGERIVRLTAAGSQTLTLPSYGVANNVPVGCTLKVVNRSDATMTISAAAGELIVGAGAAALTFALAANTSAEIFFDGAQWAVL